MKKEFLLKINDTVVPVIWEDNASAAELKEYASEVPVSIAMHMYGGWEQVGPLGRSFTDSDMQITAHSGDIMLYSGNQIVMFYGDNTWAYTKLGHIDLPDEDVVRLLGSEAVTITLTVQ